MLLQECLELIWVINFLQAPYVWRPVQNLCHDAGAPLLPIKAPLWACLVQLICMLVRLQQKAVAMSDDRNLDKYYTGVMAFLASVHCRGFRLKDVWQGAVRWQVCNSLRTLRDGSSGGIQRLTRRSARMLYDMMRTWLPSLPGMDSACNVGAFS